jgi:DNA-binding protein HU-beta
MTALNKTAFIAALAEHSGEPRAVVARFLESFIQVTTANLKKGNDVGITGFGSFKTGKRAARVGRNPSSGEKIKIAASKTVRFSAGATLKASINPKAKAAKAVKATK